MKSLDTVGQLLSVPSWSYARSCLFVMNYPHRPQGSP